MRYLVGLVLAVAMVASPLGVSAQADDDDLLSGEPAPEEPASDEPWRHPHDRRTYPQQRELALELKLDDADTSGYSLEYVDPDWESLERAERARKKRRRRLGLGIGLGVGLPLLAMGLGGGLAYASMTGGL